MLITHAGLTRGRWHAIGAPHTSAAAANLLNRDVGQPVTRVTRGGSLTGANPGTDAAAADVTWAKAIDELYQPWLAAGDMPFNQIHGHAAPWNWSTQDWWPTATPRLQAATTVDQANRRTTTVLAHAGREGRVAMSVDWRLGNTRSSNQWPLLSLTPD